MVAFRVALIIAIFDDFADSLAIGTELEELPFGGRDIILVDFLEGDVFLERLDVLQVLAEMVEGGDPLQSENSIQLLVIGWLRGERGKQRFGIFGVEGRPNLTEGDLHDIE